MVFAGFGFSGEFACAFAGAAARAFERLVGKDHAYGHNRHDRHQKAEGQEKCLHIQHSFDGAFDAPYALKRPRLGLLRLL